MRQPKLKFLHSADALSRPKLDRLRRVSTSTIKASLLPGEPDSLKVRPDGTVLNGHHRLAVLLERGENLDVLPREIIDKEDDS